MSSGSTDMRYFIRQTWNNIQLSWGIALQAILVMSVAFLLLGSFGLLALQVETVLQRWEREAPVILYLKQQLPPLERARLLQDVKKFQEVKRLRIVTPKQAMARMRKALGKKGKVLDGLDTPLLPLSVEIDLKGWARHPKALQQIKVGLSKIEGVQEVDVGQRWFAPLWDLVYWVRIVLFGGSALLLMCSCLIAAGTIRLALFVHRDEIDIMRLLGATESFIRFPFYLEGALKGTAAAGLALAILAPFFWSLDSRYGSSFVAFTTTPLRFFDALQIAIFLVSGCLSGLVGSWLAFVSARSSAHQSSQRV